jgi:glycosyltransferase involved in cell wall biosynthesis
MSNGVIYSVIVPIYNEELVIDESYIRLKKVMDCTKENYEIVFVNDGSKDKTRGKAEEICKNDEKVKLINFSRNFGHQAAITAGMDLALGDAVVVIDADLQDPPEVILKMIDKWKEGYEVVYGKRTTREGETFFKKITAKMYYRLLKSMTSVDVPVDTGDFRLIDRKVCDSLIALPEKNRYVRGLVSWVGYKQTCVEFTRQERFAGDTKYPLKKMIKLAFDGMTSLSYKPLVIAGYFGVLAFFIGIVSMVVTIVKDMLNKSKIIDFGMMISINMMMFGITLGCIGIMGQYIGRIFDESKGRPIYIIDSTTNYKRSDKKISA